MPTKKKTFTYPYPRPSVTVDLVAFTVRDEGLHVLVVKRKAPPFEGMYAYPGGFLDLDEEPLESVARETHEETGLILKGPVFPLGFYGEVDRDPRGRTISLVHSAIIRAPADDPVAGDDAAEALWMPLDNLLGQEMAFDHSAILEDALRWLTRYLAVPATVSAFLPEVFTEADVQSVLKRCGQEDTDAGDWCAYAQERGLCERMPGRKKQYRSLLMDATELRRGEFKA